MPNFFYRDYSEYLFLISLCYCYQFFPEFDSCKILEFLTVYIMAFSNEKRFKTMKFFRFFWGGHDKVDVINRVLTFVKKFYWSQWDRKTIKNFQFCGEGRWEIHCLFLLKKVESDELLKFICHQRHVLLVIFLRLWSNL